MESPDTLKFLKTLAVILMITGAALLATGAITTLGIKLGASMSLALLLYGVLCGIIGGFFYAYAHSEQDR